MSISNIPLFLGDTTFDRHANKQVHGGTHINGVNTVRACKEKCSNDAFCGGVDFNKGDHTCWKLDMYRVCEPNSLIPSSGNGSDQYRKSDVCKYY